MYRGASSPCRQRRKREAHQARQRHLNFGPPRHHCLISRQQQGPLSALTRRSLNMGLPTWGCCKGSPIDPSPPDRELGAQHLSIWPHSRPQAPPGEACGGAQCKRHKTGKKRSWQASVNPISVELSSGPAASHQRRCMQARCAAGGQAAGVAVPVGLPAVPA